MQGKIYKIVKILGRMNSRTVMMERFQDVRVLMTLLSTEDSNDSQKRIRADLTIHPTLAYPPVLFTHPTPVSPCLAQRGSDMRGSTVVQVVATY